MRILTISNSTTGPYGYGIVTKNLCRDFRDDLGHEIWNFGNQTCGDIAKDEYGTPNLPVRFNMFYVDAINDYLSSLKPDLVLTIFDIIIPDAIPVIQSIKAVGLPIISYATVNYSPAPLGLVDRAKYIDLMVAPSKWGLAELQRAGVSNATYAPHGIDPELYFHEPTLKEKTKKEFGLEGKFIYLMVQRNRHPQKNITQLFAAWQAFLAKNPELKDKVMLLCVTDIMEPQSSLAGLGVPLDQLRMLLGLQNSIMFLKQKIVGTPQKHKVIAVPETDKDGFYFNANFRLEEDEMRKIYNMADCTVSSSLGESFCLPLLESGACGTPVIAAKHTTSFELVQEPETGLLCDIIEPQLSFNFSNIFQFSVPSMIGCLEKMYHEQEFRETCKENGIKNAKNYHWKDIVKNHWKPILDHYENKMNELDYGAMRLGL